MNERGGESRTPFGERMEVVRRCLGSKGEVTSVRQFARDLKINHERYRKWERPGRPPWGGHDELVEVLEPIAKKHGLDGRKLAAWAFTGEGDPPVGPSGTSSPRSSVVSLQAYREHTTPPTGTVIATRIVQCDRCGNHQVLDAPTVGMLRAAVKHRDWELVREVVALSESDDGETAAGTAVAQKDRRAGQRKPLPGLDSNQELRDRNCHQISRREAA